MSSFDPARRGAGSDAFAPLLPSGTATGRVARTSVLPDLNPPQPVGGDVPPAPSAPDPLETARQAGYAAGFADGEVAAAQRLLGGATTFATAIEEVARFRRTLLDRYQRELLELALGVARKVVQRELAEHPEHWLEMIREAVRRALDRETIRIRVGTILHRYLVEQLPRLRSLLEDVKELDLAEDTALSETGCVIESRYGDLDLGIDSQMSAIRAALTGSP